MATRATYNVDGVCFYIHWDGYEAGAAAYFWAMYQAAIGGSKGGHAEAFMRGNPSAELTESHDAHGDTEYRYELVGDALTVRKRSSWKGAPEFEAVWSGNWWDFINQNPAHIEGFERLAPRGDWSECLRTRRRQTVVRTRSHLVADIKAAGDQLTAYACAHPQYTGNLAGTYSQFTRATAALAAYDQAGKATAAA
jgi:hypothetical protein